jgi:DNA recombination protein RmuC
MDTNTIIIIIAIVVGFVALIAFVNKRMNDLAAGKGEISPDFLKDLSERIDRGLTSSRESSERIILNVTEKLKDIENTNKQVVGIADQLQGLENVLKNPKQRGILGEYLLETLLKNLFQPNQYQLQYKFKDGSIADAVLFVKDKTEPQSIIPIDSKFSLENYNRICNEKDTSRKSELEKAFKQDLKNRIDETAKYIKPGEGTMDFAFMFIPSEGVYYDLLINQVGAIKVNTKDLIDYAFREKKVIIVSPTSFGAYLQTVMQGLRAFKIEKSAAEIRENVQKLSAHMRAYGEYTQKVGTHLATTVNAYNAASKEFGKIDKDVTRITGDTIDYEVELLDKPSDE